MKKIKGMGYPVSVLFFSKDQDKSISRGQYFMFMLVGLMIEKSS
jgi:hypothetical protein